MIRDSNVRPLPPSKFERALSPELEEIEKESVVEAIAELLDSAPLEILDQLRAEIAVVLEGPSSRDHKLARACLSPFDVGNLCEDGPDFESLTRRVQQDLLAGEREIGDAQEPHFWGDGLAAIDMKAQYPEGEVLAARYFVVDANELTEHLPGFLNRCRWIVVRYPDWMSADEPRFYTPHVEFLDQEGIRILEAYTYFDDEGNFSRLWTRDHVVLSMNRGRNVKMAGRIFDFRPRGTPGEEYNDIHLGVKVGPVLYTGRDTRRRVINLLYHRDQEGSEMSWDVTTYRTAISPR